VTKRILTTFSGRFGDILWSLPTVREISKREGTKVDMGIMPQYKSLLPLLQMQPYIDTAFTIDDWICVGSPCGDQPWQPPVRVEEHYEKSFHLTYRRHPQSNEALIDFIAQQQGFELTEPVVPFIETNFKYAYLRSANTVFIAVAFNALYQAEKDAFRIKLKELLPENIQYLDVLRLPWTDAAAAIKCALAFVGCRSSNFVLAHGVGQKNIFVFEPHPSRNAHGHFGYTFGNPHWKDVNALCFGYPEQSAEDAIQNIQKWVKEKENEYATVKA
jgi:hypothetical protein